MIRIRKDRTVHEHRSWLRSSTPSNPVVSVPPDTRRGAVLMTSQLEAMGCQPQDLRGRRNQATLERWWRAWTTGLPVRSVTLLSPQRAQPHALCDYLVRAADVAEVVLLEKLASTDGYEAIMEELGGADVQETEPPERLAPAPALPAAWRCPELPRVGTPSFISAVRQMGPPEESTAIEKRYRRVLNEAVDHFSREMTPESLIGFLQNATADASSDDDIRITLHAMQAACWLNGTDVILDTEGAIARAAATLRVRANGPLWRSIGSQVDANRATAMGFAVLGHAVDEIVELDLATAQRLLDEAREQPLPGPLQRSLRIAISARRADGADSADRLLMDPTGRDITDRSVGRWFRVAVEDHLAPISANNARWRTLDAAAKLKDLGIEWT